MEDYFVHRYFYDSLDTDMEFRFTLFKIIEKDDKGNYKCQRIDYTKAYIDNPQPKRQTLEYSFGTCNVNVDFEAFNEITRHRYDKLNKIFQANLQNKTFSKMKIYLEALHGKPTYNQMKIDDFEKLNSPQ